MKLTCIMCPIGCNLEVIEEKGELVVSGNKCKRGQVYARMEITCPKRVVTSLFPVKDKGVVSCKTNGDIEKKYIFEVLKEIKSNYVEAPVKIGDVLIENVLDSGVDIVATSNKL